MAVSVVWKRMDDGEMYGSGVEVKVGFATWAGMRVKHRRPPEREVATQLKVSAT